VASRALLTTAELTLGEFSCAPGDPAWDEVNTNMGAWPHLVFPRTHVVIAQEGRAPALVTPNHVVYYRPYTRYRRALRDPRGDRCLWLEVSPALLTVPDAPAGPCESGRFLLAIALARHLLAEPVPDRLFAEEAALRLVGASAPVRDCELAEAAKEWLAVRFDQPLSLSAVASALSVSRFHLARVFRAHTGFSMTSYVHELRLRRAVERLADEPGVSLTRLAVELGYCSPSHFCDRFRAAFGVAPSRLRGLPLRTIIGSGRRGRGLEVAACGWRWFSRRLASRPPRPRRRTSCACCTSGTGNPADSSGGRSRSCATSTTTA
jgi:AraC-like DNA-binding protein